MSSGFSTPNLNKVNNNNDNNNNKHLIWGSLKDNFAFFLQSLQI